jgi:hypothetical protein
MSAAAVAGLSLVAAPAASADVTGPLKVELAKGRGVVETAPDYWYVHSTSFEFSVTVTDVGTVNDTDAVVFVSLPASVDVVGYNAEDNWQCVDRWDDDVRLGVDCVNTDIVVPQEAWPVLKLKAMGNQHTVDTIDAYATSEQGVEEAHDGVGFFLDTST